MEYCHILQLPPTFFPLSFRKQANCWNFEIFNIRFTWSHHPQEQSSTSSVVSQLEGCFPVSRRGTEQQSKLESTATLSCFSRMLSGFRKLLTSCRYTTGASAPSYVCRAIMDVEVVCSFLGTHKLHTHILRTDIGWWTHLNQTLRTLPNSCSCNVTCTCQGSDLQCF